MYQEDDPRTLEVLNRALRSTSRSVRMRAVSMLAELSCEGHDEWLDSACQDRDLAVREVAAAVRSWTACVEPPPWPQREDPAFDLAPRPLDHDVLLEASSDLGWQWEYAVEVWRGDGMLVGVFLCATCQEDIEHAKKIALGQAVLASTEPLGDRFDPSDAAAFVVAQRRVRRAARPGGAHQGERRA